MTTWVRVNFAPTKYAVARKPKTIEMKIETPLCQDAHSFPAGTVRLRVPNTSSHNAVANSPAILGIPVA